MVIVDIQIAFHGDLHAETTVGRDLVQHMVKETHTGVDLAAAFTIQPDLNVDLRLFGVALNVRVAVTLGQLLTNFCPVKGGTVIAQPGDTHVLRQCNIGHAIANDIAIGFIQHVIRQVAFDQLYLRLAAVTFIGRQVWADQHLIKFNALRGQHLHHQVMRAVKIRLRETVGTQPVLVSDHHQLIAGFLQLEQHRDYIGFKSQFVETIDLKIGWRLRNKGTVTIDKEGLLAHTFSAFRASITR